MDRQTLKNIVERRDTRGGRIFDSAVQGLILFSLVTFSIETLPDLSHRAHVILWWIEFVSVVLFTIEYLLRFFLADSKRKFFFSFFGFVDLAAILPFYITVFVTTGIDARALRAVRLFRLIRALKFVRYNKAHRRMRLAFMIAKEELVLYFIATLIMLYFAAVGIYYFESAEQPEAFKSVFHSLWWAVTTLTTVGYGDAYPITTGGRIFTFFVLMIGLGIVSVPAGLVSSAIIQARDLEDELAVASELEYDEEVEADKELVRALNE